MNIKEKAINVVQLQYSTESGGSAALRLQKAFVNGGINSVIISLIEDDIVAIENIKYLGKRSALKSKIDIRLQAYLTRKQIKSFGLFSYPLLGTNVAVMEQIQNSQYKTAKAQSPPETRHAVEKILQC